MKKRAIIAIAASIGISSVAMAEPSAQEIRRLQVKLMEETEIVARIGISEPIRDFKSDGNPKTLELVFLEKEAPGMNSVSEDGEVIFLFEASDQLQSQLIGKAFEIRAKSRLASK